jgi:hypothetical protein
MHIAQLRLGLAAIAAAAVPMISACTPSVASLDCEEIATKAKEISQNQPIKIQNITNVRETSRNESEARCTGDAALADGGSGPVYMKAYQEGGNTMVAYQGTPFP